MGISFVYFNKTVHLQETTLKGTVLLPRPPSIVTAPAQLVAGLFLPGVAQNSAWRRAQRRMCVGSVAFMCTGLSKLCLFEVAVLRTVPSDRECRVPLFRDTVSS